MDKQSMMVRHHYDIDDKLSASYEACRKIAKYNSSFYLGMMVLPYEQRNAMYAIYAWLRAADDIADNVISPYAERRKKLDEFYQTTKTVLRKESSYCQQLKESYWLAFKDTVHTFNIPLKHLRLMIDGQKTDLSKHFYTNFNELYHYCYLVASTVGFMCMKIWRVNENAKLLLMAEKFGVALQLTNVLRDIIPDLQLQRIYLPSQLISSKRHTIKEFKHLPKKKLMHGINELIKINKKYYAESKNLYLSINNKASLSFLILFETYHTIFLKICADPKIVLTRNKIKLNMIDKMRILTISTSKYLRHQFGLN